MATPLSIIKRSLSTSAVRQATIKNVTIIGGGLMGSGIAQVSAATGHNVTLVELNTDVLKKAQAGIQNSLGRVAKKMFKEKPADGDRFISETLKRLRGVTSAEEGVQDADLVIEAIVENMDVKHKLFKAIDAAAPAKTIFASNTSSLPISEIASVTNRKDRFGGLHFFNPVPVMRLLEVIRIPETNEETYQAMMAWGKAVGKTCVTCKDTPGFIVNRLLVPYMAEAVRMLERGDATARDIDTAMKLGAGYPMGPIELSDYVGLDTTAFIVEGWHKKYPDNPLFAPPEKLRELVKQGKLGMKTGEGFYKHSK
ncbi:hydroxyacyl-coenzyme A dehydrogenase, mitochondrial-like [Atheta coriaria]|uniref:hydroxyacyl-coenzyme A dehydrogenase, mitochondrial-like n=1 Tax=Dalotia coriaria TaxID=877792 RepID=UPI0031F42E0C